MFLLNFLFPTIWKLISPFLISTCLLLTSNCLAATYYVSTTGSDSLGNGSKISPWASPNHAAAVAVAGDTVYVHGGLYKGEVFFNTSGTALKPITFEAYPSEAPILDLNGSWPGGNGGYWTGGWWEGVVNFNASYITFSGFEVRNGENPVSAVGGGQGIYIHYGSNLSILNNVVHNIQDHGIMIQGDNNLIKNNTVYNTCLLNLNGANSNNGWGSGISITGLRNGTTAYTGNIIENNTVHDNWGEGIYGYYGIQSTTITKNIVYNNWGLNIGLSDSVNGVISDNLSYFSGASNSMINYGLIAVAVESDFVDPEPNNNAVYNNLVYGGAIQPEQFVSGRTTHNTYIYFNTVINPSGNAFVVNGTYDNLQLVNNIFDGAGINTYFAQVALARNNYWLAASSTGPYLSNPKRDVFGDALTYIMRASGSTNPGQLTPNWFSLASNSPAIGKGVYVSSVPLDAIGASRPSLPAIGALQ